MRLRILSLLAVALLAAARLITPATGAPPPTTRPVIVKVEQTGVHWADAAFGAGAALGVVLLAAAVRAARNPSSERDIG